MSQKRQTVVIIGASFAGLQVAHGLLKGVPDRIKLVLINPSDRWYFNIAAPRIFGKPNAFNTDQYLLPIPSSFAKYPRGSFEFVKGRATNIDTASKTVTISNPGTTQISYDHLVIASGSSTDSLTQGTYVPFKSTGEETFESSILNAQKEISKARSIVIGGAGPIGVELAGELAEAWAGRSGTSITLVSATPHVLPSLKINASRAAEKLLAKHNVKLVTGRKVTEAVQQSEGEKQWIVSLDNGEKLKADVYVAATGVTPNNEFIPPEFLSPDGWVIVDEQFRVGQQPIYALGDITIHPIRTSIKVMEQVPVVVANLKADILGGGKRSKYNANEKIMMMVPVGSSSGTGQMMGMVAWGKMVAMVKGKDFFVSKAPGMVGLA